VGAVLAGSYDLVLMDCEMPGLDGFRATERIRESEDRARRTRIVAMTAHATDEAREKCLAHGMDDYVTKPMRGARLDAAIERRTTAPAEAAAPADAGLLDDEIVGDLRDEFGESGASDRLVALIESFLGNAATGVETLRAAAAVGDAETVRSVAHRLKGSSANLGAARLRTLASELEQSPSSADVPERVDELAAALDATRPLLTNAVAAG
jgi:CheY-like chemotaxis protein